MTEQQIRQNFVECAKDYLGLRESDGSHRVIIDLYNGHKPLARSYKVKYTDAWCATFVSAIAIECGLTDIIPTECSCPKMVELFRKMGRWQETDSIIPLPGDIIMYDWQDSAAGDNTGTPDHVGIVVNVSGSTITIIEGNIDNAVGYRTLKVNGKYIRGYCRPNFASKASTAAPAAKPKKSLDDVVTEVINGKWSTGADRKARLEAAGYSYAEVQAAVNARLAPNPKKSVEEVAREVLRGKWGNGAVRKAKLEAAGYNYAAVQAAVNKMA